MRLNLSYNRDPFSCPRITLRNVYNRRGGALVKSAVSNN
jgi:hypothetical protein